MPAWDALSRWRAIRVKAKWIVRSEAGAEAPKPSRFDTYKDALRRSDDLNHDEQQAVIRHGQRGAA